MHVTLNRLKNESADDADFTDFFGGFISVNQRNRRTKVFMR